MLQHCAFAVAQAITLVVTYTPVSMATYTTLLSFGSTTTAFAGAFGRFAVTLTQLAAPSVDRYTVGELNPMIVAYTVRPVGSFGSSEMPETSNPPGLNRPTFAVSFVTVPAVTSVHGVAPLARFPWVVL